MITLFGEEVVGEVRVHVKLTNATDESLVRRGMMLADQVRSYETDAVVDTGAVRCVLPPHVADLLGLARVDRHTAEYADGRQDEVDVTEGVVFEILRRRTLEEALVLGDEVLIGQAVLEKTDLFVDCRGQRVVPNPAHPDQPVNKIRSAR